MQTDSISTWIHLSDIHIGHGSTTHIEDQQLVLSALHADVVRTVDGGTLRPDAIFVTGDIAFSGACRSNDEYERAAQWLRELAKAVGLGNETVFIVPGNHDVQRTVDKTLQARLVLKGLRAGQDSIDDALTDDLVRAYLMERQANYLSFATGFAPGCRGDAEAKGGQLYWRHSMIARQGIRVRVVGLNTAMLAADETQFEIDQGKLSLGAKQLSATLINPDVTSDEVVIVLSHHPLHGGWLRDEVDASRWIRSKSHIHLTGHVHEASSERSRCGGGTDFVTIAAGAVHGEKTPHGYPARHGYSIGSLVLADGILRACVWPRMWSDANRDFRMDIDNVPDGETHAEHMLVRVRLSAVPAPVRSADLPIEPITPPISAVSVGRLPAGTEHFIGREDEIKALDAAWADDGVHVVTTTAWGGTGKSSLVAEWIARMTRARWNGAEKVFGWSFYSQGTHGNAGASADAFIDSALRFFGDSDPVSGNAWERGERLARLIRAQRTLLVLDGLEPLQEPERSGGRLRDRAMVALLRELAAGMTGLCVVTSRQFVGELGEFINKTVLRLKLDQLNECDGAELLSRCGVEGDADERREISRAVKGHALTIILLGHYIADALERDARRWREVPLARADDYPGEHARKVMEAYDRWFGPGPERAILRIVGLSDRPLSARCVTALLAKPALPGVTDTLRPLNDRQLKMLANHLRRAGLIAPMTSSDDTSLDAHPLVRECFGELLLAENPKGFRDAHARLYDYLCRFTPKWPDTLTNLQPLYQAVWHGCKAGLYTLTLQTFRSRIRRDEAFSIYHLGAHGADLGALAGFFDADWSRPKAELNRRDQAWILGEVSMSLHALGRTREAKEPRQRSLEMYLALKDWERAAIQAGNLALIHESFGELQDALSTVIQCISFVDRTEDLISRAIYRAQQAHVLYLLGETESAMALFGLAEDMQSKIHPKLKDKFPFLYSVQGVFFCELLLDLGRPEEVMDRANYALGVAVENGYVLDIALDHLSLARAKQALGDNSGALDDYQQAVEGLRAAGEQEWLASSLAYRAGLFRATGKMKAARQDVTEALRLADRCELPLAACDARIEEARILIDLGDCDSARDSIEKARLIVSQCGYGRQDGVVSELERLLEVV